MFAWLRRRKKRASQGPSSPTNAVVSQGPGRRRLEEVPYLLPSDFEESNRLDMQHFMLKTAFGADALAPIQQPRSILDVACGTGRWAREMAQRFPQANVVGMDLVEPTTDSIAYQQKAFGTLPENYVFIQGNIFQGLPFPDGAFDYVHMRFVALAVPMEKWPALVQEIMRVCAPEGWIELVDFNTPLGGGPAFQRISQLWHKLADTFKMDNQTASHLASYLRAAGAVNVQERRVSVNTANPQDRAARMCAVDLDAGVESSAPALIKLGLATSEEMQQLRQTSRQEYQSQNVEWQFCAAFGQRPQ